VKKVNKEVLGILAGKSIKILSSIKTCLVWIVIATPLWIIAIWLLCLTMCVNDNAHIDSEPEAVKEDKIIVVYVDTPERIVYTDMPVDELETAILNVEYLARCVEAEAGNQGKLGKAYVCDCILNRFESGKYKTIEDVINAPGQFSCVKDGQINSKPTEETYEVIEEELKERKNSEIKYFRTGSYHSNTTPCFQYKDHFFSK